MSDITCSAAEGRESDSGTGEPISRRDFLDGIALTAGLVAVGAGESRVAGPEMPHTAMTAPDLVGVRGDTAHALSVPHALRDGRFWEHAGPAVPTGESYDLVVVGAGSGGLSAAEEWLRADPGARVLVLDNHERLGERRPRAGHAPYDSVMCDRETFPVETLVRHEGGAERWISRLPVADRAREDLLRLYRDAPDWFPGLSPEEKQERLAGLTYSDFLLRVCRAHPDVERFCRTMSSAEWAYDTRAFGAIDAWGSARGWAYPGLDGLKLDTGKPSRFNSPGVRRMWRHDGEPDRATAFPDRPGKTGHSVAFIDQAGETGHSSAFLDQFGETGPSAAFLDRFGGTGRPASFLDRPGDPVRLRLSSPVVFARDEGPLGASVGYFDGHEVRSVTAGAVILACWSTVIPYLVPDLPAEQRRALAAAVRLPLVEAVVRLRDERAWQRVGVRRTRWTGAYWCLTELAGPATARLVAAPCRSELGPAEGAVAGRRALMRTPYGFLEHSAREQLARLLGPGGFDPVRDVEAIEIHRWGHGYAPEYCRPWHAFYPDGPFPAELARRRFGRIAIAGSDTAVGRDGGAVAAACRAVAELWV